MRVRDKKKFKSSPMAIDAVTVFNLSGVAVATAEDAIGETRIGVSPGVYIVKCRSGERAATIMVVVE